MVLPYGPRGAMFDMSEEPMYKAGALAHTAGLGCRVQGAGCRVQGSEFRVQGSGFRVYGSGFTVQDCIRMATLARGTSYPGSEARAFHSSW